MRPRSLLPALVAAGLALAATLSCALGQTGFPTQAPNINAPGAVNMCPNSTGTMVPCSAITPLPVAVISGVNPNAPYPVGARPITGNAAGTTAAVVGTLAAAPGKTTYLCGFVISGIGGTAALGPVTVANLAGSSMVFQLSSSAAGVNQPITFFPCIPAQLLNTAITITTTANGTATAVNVNSWGFQL